MSDLTSISDIVAGILAAAILRACKRDAADRCQREHEQIEHAVADAPDGEGAAAHESTRKAARKTSSANTIGSA